MEEREIIIDIERCVDNGERGDDKAGDSHSLNVDASSYGESWGGVSPEKTRRVSMSGKKPPRPPRSLSLDAADQKLIKEISELLMIKRARMKALRKTKAAKGMSASASASASASTSSAANLIAMFFTILCCIVIVFQGCHSWGRNSSVIGEETAHAPLQWSWLQPSPTSI